jgi:integrase
MASVRRHRGKYQVRWRVGTSERSQTFDKRRDAERFAAKIATDLDRGDYIDPRAGLLLFGQYADRWLELRGDRAKSTLDRDRSYLDSMILPTFGRLSVAGIKTTDIEAWVVKLHQAPATVAKALGMVRAILDLARRDQAIRVNPASDVRPPRRPRRNQPGRALTDEEINRILKASEDVDGNLAPLVWLLGRCGLRIGEALAIRRSDIDLRTGMLSVSRSMSRTEGPRPVKGRSSEADGRSIPMPPDVVDRLRRHLESQTVTTIDGLLFTNRSGGPVGYHNWRSRKWCKIVDQAGVGAVRPHDLRHSAITRLFVVDRWSPAEVQAWAGHSDPRITLAVYTHVNSDALPTPSTIGFGR